MTTATPPAAPAAGTVTGESPQVVPVRRYGHWVATAVIVVAGVLLLWSVLTNPNFEWDVALGYLGNGQVLHGLLVTLMLTLVAMVVGCAIGVVMALGRESRNPVVAGAAFGYVAFFRGTPLLVQLIFWFNLAALYPVLTLGIPSGPHLFELDANTVITPMVAAILGLGLNEGAYMSEIVRAGLQSVDPGQIDAAEALGMRKSQVFRRIVLPQAMRVIIPPTGNQTISMLKTTSLVSVIAIPDVLFAVQTIYSRNFQVVPLLITVSIWYLAVTTVLSIGQHFVERRFRRGDNRLQEPSLLATVRSGLVPWRRSRPPGPGEPTEGSRR
ncbi:amino acid ABC transporter permease [Phycicoccus endophyticus]|uniref:Amino acid ABC transporter permease n=1 Tax=Phycicoccus endophyticus TaxID=1690220 RepID=A0A7G9QZQ4_9MICO|nr:amino acid ABC transporter permease [Phycicoccus endophyticus]NHI20022.1 amino acid ABC transporter permease [Phycicoccus endophyticus]QNN48829.1 amino acid ABC transporter permease [Phycicoccus endophyticus]GGL42534.1 amino acid ABC transporter permease [Phycicoccus endophyticus]